MQRALYEILHPEIYHGHRKSSPYFEGWYYKLITRDEQTRYAVIPGIFRGQNGGNDHAFIQVLDGMTGRATYHEFPIDAFHAAEETFDVRIGANRFHRNGLELALDDAQLRMTGTLNFHDGAGWPVTLLSPGVMGWYAWLPIMETYHGVLSFDHRISGTLEIEQRRVDFADGRGYLEKDWGQNFPSGYIWQQSNHFSTPTTSLFLSIAIIPRVGRVFRGFIAGFYHHRRLYKFATYTGARIEHLRLTDDHVYITLTDRRYRLETVAERRAGGLLKAPIRTEMHKRVDETLDSSISVKFSTRAGELIFNGTGRNAGLEVHGDLETLLKL